MRIRVFLHTLPFACSDYSAKEGTHHFACPPFSRISAGTGFLGKMIQLEVHKVSCHPTSSLIALGLFIIYLHKYVN
jgi:hypothetical protein